MTALLQYDKIKSLIYTEKSNKQLVDGKYHFEVNSSCSKKENRTRENGKEKYAKKEKDLAKSKRE
jgi:hypothetical protein